MSRKDAAQFLDDTDSEEEDETKEETKEEKASQQERKVEAEKKTDTKKGKQMMKRNLKKEEIEIEKYEEIDEALLTIISVNLKFNTKNLISIKSVWTSSNP